LQQLTLSRAKALLRDRRTVLDTSLRVGLSGSSRLHDLFVSYEAMTPGEYKSGGAGIQMQWDLFESPIGKIALAQTPQGICSLSFSKSASEALRDLKESWPNARPTRDTGAIRPLADEVCRRLAGGKRRELNLLLKGTPFQVKVWEALLRIPEGRVTTYQDLAKAIGAPKAVRAVGTAVGANPIGYLIPCHRVIRSTGAIGEYHWSSARKSALLAIESSRASSSSGRERG
jgi:AraC family transcriptional regulator of adaptative response/methylated-DNA-[protein]-cysteine methyltransferase